MTLLAGSCTFSDALDPSSICDRICADQFSGSWQVQSCDRATFAAAIGGGLALSRNDRALLAGDVRLDNRNEIIRALGVGSDLSDADLLLMGWSRLGVRSLDLIVGDFAFAVHDVTKRNLTLVRDATGQRPLFYRFGVFGAGFASAPHALRPLGGSGADLRSLADRLLHIDNPALPTFFKDIHCVPIGQIVEIDYSGCRQQNWWSPSVDSSDFNREFPDPVEAYRTLLDEAVRCRITSAPPVATHLSSGYDSSAVTATAARIARNSNDVIAFTSVPAADFEAPYVKGRIADEFSRAATVASRYGFRQIRVPPRENLMEFVRAYGARVHQPVFVPINISWWADIRERAAALGARDLLTGKNGNLSISAGGYAAFSDYVLRRDWRGLMREIRAGAKRPDMTLRGVLFNSFEPWIPLGLATRLRQIFLGSSLENDFLRPEWREKARIDAAERRVPSNYGAARLALCRTDDTALFSKNALIDYGIAESDPTSDRRIVEFSLRWPPDRLLFNGKSRPLARAALADRLPASLLDSPLRGLQSADWFIHLTQAQARDLLDEMRGNESAEALFDFTIMGEAIERWPIESLDKLAVHYRYGVQLVSALMVGLFLVQHSSHPDDDRPSILG